MDLNCGIDLAPEHWMRLDMLGRVIHNAEMKRCVSCAQNLHGNKA